MQPQRALPEANRCHQRLAVRRNRDPLFLRYAAPGQRLRVAAPKPLTPEMGRALRFRAEVHPPLIGRPRCGLARPWGADLAPGGSAVERDKPATVERSERTH